jgi:hypothetical protein
MTENGTPAGTPALDAEATRIRRTRRAVIFGVVMATAEMGILLYFMYC